MTLPPPNSPPPDAKVTSVENAAGVVGLPVAVDPLRVEQFVGHVMSYVARGSWGPTWRRCNAEAGGPITGIWQPGEWKRLEDIALKLLGNRPWVTMWVRWALTTAKPWTGQGMGRFVALQACHAAFQSLVEDAR